MEFGVGLGVGVGAVSRGGRVQSTGSRNKGGGSALALLCVIILMALL